MSDDRISDRELLGVLLREHHEDLTEWEQGAFADMLQVLNDGHDSDGRPRDRLSTKQREIAETVHERIVPQYLNLVSRGLVPRGKEVPDPPALQHRPLKPPPRRTEG
jgi:hypothetical protein